MPVETGVTIRRYEEGDEVPISSIFDSCYSSYSGLTTRTPDIWKWFNVLRCGEENVLVAVIGDRVVGALTVCFNGEILDPCYARGEDGEAIMASLLDAAEVHARESGIETITLDIPSDDEVMRAAARSLGMRKRVRGKAISARVIDHRHFIPRLLGKSGKKPPDGTYRLEIIRGRGGEVKLAFEVIRGEITTLEGDDADRYPEIAVDDLDLRIRVDEAVLNSIIFNGRTSISDWIFRRVAITPFWRILRGRAFLMSLDLGLRILTLRGSFF